MKVERKVITVQLTADNHTNVKINKNDVPSSVFYLGIPTTTIVKYSGIHLGDPHFTSNGALIVTGLWAQINNSGMTNLENISNINISLDPKLVDQFSYTYAYDSIEPVKIEAIYFKEA